MHRSTTLTVLVFLFFVSHLYSQQEINVIVTTPKYMEWNDLTFRFNQNGI